MLGVPLTTPPGEYAVIISAVNGSGEERTAVLSVTVDALATVPTGATTPPVVLLDGWQRPTLTSSCPMSSDSSGTFGYLDDWLLSPPDPAISNYAVPQVYFFENCTECPNCAIEQLGADLATFLNSIQYSNGTPVPHVDVVAHSMGGLIVRSYLSGKQSTSGVFGPPSTPKIRKAVFLGTPHFGSFQADSALADILFAAGNQTNEMKPGSQFVWDLATWNQFGDDLRGTDAVALIGNAGSYGNLSSASDGVVALTSGSLDFAAQGRTRIVPYCHVPTNSGFEESVEADYLGCTGPGIADVTSALHPAYQIVSSFLLGSAAWQSVGTAPAQNQYLSEYGGIVVADVNSEDQYLTPSSVLWGSVVLTPGAAGYLFYNDMVYGTGTFVFGSSGCGSWTETAGVYSAVRCKGYPIVSSVGPLLSGAGRVVQAGTTITVTGVEFGAQQCGACSVVASNPQSTALQISSWSDTSIRAFLPASFVGIATIGVTNASGYDAINIMAAPAPIIVVAPTSLQFAYTVGGTIPAAQSIQITNSGGGTLNWSATASATWLSVAVASGTAPSTLSVLVSPTGLGAGTYTGSVQISAPGASNSPVSVTVTLTVAPAPPVLAVSPQALTFNYTVGGTVPAAQSIQVTNSGGGTLNWSATASAMWLSVAVTSGTAPSTLSVLVSPTGLGAGTYTGSVQISAPGASNSPVSVTVTLTVAPAPPILAVSPEALTFNYTAGGTIPAAQSIQITNSGGGTLNWSATTSATWLSVAVASGTAPSTLSVLVSPTGLGAGTYTRSVQISAAGASNSPVSVAVTLTVAPAPPVLAVSPQALTFNYPVGGTIPAAQGISITNTGGGALSWVASASAAWVGLSPASGTAPATLSVSANPATLAAGSYSATVLITAAGATGSPASVSVTLVVQAPSITGVTNGASFQAGFASATWVSIFGTNLSQTTRPWQSSDFVNGLLPSSLSGVSVTINGRAAYVEYISPTQVNVLAPDDATVGAVQVQVTTAQATSNSFTAQKEQFAPAFFTIGGSYVAAQHADYTPVGKPGLIAGATSTPAKPGEIILIYGTGFGPTSPPLPSAQPVTTPALLANAVQVTIGGVVAPVAWAGLADGAGLYQFDVTVPNVPNGDAAVLAQIGGVQTQTGVLITVQQ
jgi:uncharacterized protein (TIGR03437 family)